MSSRVVVFGGTGFLGYHASRELLARGFDVVAVSRSPLPSGVRLPDEVALARADLLDADDAALRELVAGCRAVVFAAGADDRSTPQAPAHPYFHRANVEAAVRVLTLARDAGARCGVVLGSYFAHFARAWPELRLAEVHPYVRSRVEQEAAVTSLGFPVSVLELPYIFGSMPGRRPLWTPLVRYLERTPVVLYPAGGSNAVAVERVAEAIAGAVERESSGAFAVGDENLPWSELLARLAGALRVRRRIVTVPTPLVRAAAAAYGWGTRLSGREGGLDPAPFITVQTREAFFDPAPAREALGFAGGGLDGAIADTVRAALS